MAGERRSRRVGRGAPARVQPHGYRAGDRGPPPAPATATNPSPRTCAWAPTWTACAPAGWAPGGPRPRACRRPCLPGDETSCCRPWTRPHEGMRFALAAALGAVGTAGGPAGPAGPCCPTPSPSGRPPRPPASSPSGPGARDLVLPPSGNRAWAPPGAGRPGPGWGTKPGPGPGPGLGGPVPAPADPGAGGWEVIAGGDSDPSQGPAADGGGAGRRASASGMGVPLRRLQGLSPAAPGRPPDPSPAPGRAPGPRGCPRTARSTRPPAPPPRPARPGAAAPWCRGPIPAGG